MAEISKSILNSLSTSDLRALAEGNIDAVSTPGLRVLAGEEYGTGEVLSRTAERGITSTMRGLSELFGYDLDFYNRAQGLKTDLEREQEFRAMMELNPKTAFAGYLAGSVADPTNLIPIGRAKTIGQFIGQGAAVGGVAGALEPTYEGEFDDSRLKNIAVGTGFGAAVGGVAGKLIDKYGGGLNSAAKVESDVVPTPKTREEIEAELPTIAGPQPSASLLSRLPETDQAVIDKVLSRYEDVDMLPQKAFDEVADALESTNPQAAALFRGAKEAPEPPTAALLRGDPPDPVAQQQAAVLKADFEQKEALKTAKVAGDPVAESSSYLKAERTNDYRDYLTDPIRNYPLSPNQFAKMLSPDNPFKGENLKTALTQDAAMTDALAQIVGPTFGRFSREKAAKSWANVEIKGESVPYETAVSAFVNRKQEEVLGAELTSKISKALASELNQLDQLKDVARLAKEQNNEEMYAYIAQRFATVNALASSLDGNISNLGRALAYTKQVKKIINSNGTLPPYLGGLQC